MAGEEEEGSAPLLLKLPKASKEQEEHVNRSGDMNSLILCFICVCVCVREGTLWTAIAHIITAVIGAGVLSLAWSMAQLGWIAGPIAMALFAAVTLIQSTLLADCYRTPDPAHGHLRNHHYMDAVRLFLGKQTKPFFVSFSHAKVKLLSSSLLLFTSHFASHREKVNSVSHCHSREHLFYVFLVHTSNKYRVTTKENALID
ncbi:hypothetical protein BHM03_00056526 [Ensete ventricosum]|nr:hypothetical protein BHM03_00056526 [Ensete ventricosum]